MQFTVALDVSIRACRAEDLPALEWFGLFDGELIRDMYDRHERGEALMLVAEANGHASGQAWAEFAGAESGAGVIWALRVMPCLQSLRIGRQLLEACERAIAERGCGEVELTVDLDNDGAMRLYERLGYRRAGLVGPHHHRLDPSHDPAAEPAQRWLLRKRIKPVAPLAPPEEGGEST